MNSGRGKSTGARNFLKVEPIGFVGDENKEFSVLTIRHRYQKALEGLEESKRLLVIYIDEDELKVHKALLIKLEKNKLYLEYSEEIGEKQVVDIKPYFRELDW